MKYLFKTLLVLGLVTLTLSSKAFDLAGTFNNFTCMRNLGYSLAIIRAYHSYGAIDITAKDNIQRSNNAGLATDVYMFPCRGKKTAT